jgi:glycogen debranching enzyme
VSAPLDLPSAHDVETLVRAAGSTFLVTARDGNIAPAGARQLGFFQRDTRFLSYYVLELAHGGDVVHLPGDESAEAVNQIDLMVVSSITLGNLDDPENFLHIRRRQLVDAEGLLELIEFTSFLPRHLELELRIGFASDFADIFEVRGAVRPKRGEFLPPVVMPDGVDLRYHGRDNLEYASRIRFQPHPASLSPNEAVFRIALDPRESCNLEVSVTPGRRAARLPERRAFAHETRRHIDELEKYRSACTRFVADDSTMQGALDRAASDLYALRWHEGDDSIVAAGIPWFCCPFGRDALISSYESLMLNPDIAASSLAMLARYQGRREDPFTEEEPGRILHELRLGEMTRTGELPYRPYYGSVDATPLFVVVAEAYYKATADVERIRNLRPAIEAALGWIDRRTNEGRELLTYRRMSERGLDNQGWKDSRVAVCFPSGELATPPIALCEVQGYCVDAYRRGARLFDVLGLSEQAQRYAARAQRMRTMVEDTLWIPRLRRYAFAMDGKGRLVDTVVSNLGHLLWSRVATDERAGAITALLLDEHSFSGFGIRTLAAGQPAYNPLSYHNGTIWPHDNALIAKGFCHYGFTEAAARVFEGMLAALDVVRDRRLPELFCGMGRDSGRMVRYPVACSPQAWASGALLLLLQSILGIDFDAPNGKLIIRDPQMPPRLSDLRIEGLPVGPSRLSLRFRRVGRRCQVERLDVIGEQVRTVVELD